MYQRLFGLIMACAVAAMFVATSASAQIWTENFDSYAPGSGIFGQGGWTAWGDDPTYDSLVTDFISNSPANSLDVNGNSDSVYRFNINHGTIDCGEWTLTCMVYTPGDLVAANDSWFILLNTYDGTDNNWSTQVRFDPDLDEVVADFSGETLPIIYDAWTEIKVVIDLDNDTQDFYYGGSLLYSGTWTEQVSGGGQLELQAMDLFANGATSMYYDDFSLDQTRLCPGVVWQDNFDSYDAGSGIFGQGGWTAWADDPVGDSIVTDAMSFSPPNSLDVKEASDTVYRFNINHGTIDCGVYELTGMTFVPSDIVGTDTYFILLNKYDGTDNNWSTEVHWNPDSDTIIADFSGETLPIIYDEWVPIKVVIDLNNDAQEFYYGDELLYAGTWTEQVSGGGQLELQAMDLFANGCSSVYYDDFQLKQTGDCPPPFCLDMSIENLVGGETATFTVSQGEPGTRGVIAWGTGGEPSNFVDVNDWCATFGFTVRLKGRYVSIVGSGIFNDDGNLSVERPVNTNMSGKEFMFQAAQRGTCPDECMSDVYTEVVQ